MYVFMCSMCTHFPMYQSNLDQTIQDINLMAI